MKPLAIVTAASKGMGAGIARELHQRGYNLVLMSRSESIHDLARELQGTAYQGSVTNPADLERLVQLAMDRYGRIDAVVNQTGHPPTGDLLGVPDAEWHNGLDIILMNVVRMSRLVTPIMEKARRGSIVNMSSFAALEPDSDFPVSSSLRAALGSYTKLYADRYAKAGIRMNNILPGFIDSLPEKKERTARIPMGRYGTVAEVAKTTAFLLSDDASYLSGLNILIDGGLVRRV